MRANYQALRGKPKLGFGAISGSHFKAKSQSAERSDGRLLWGALKQPKSTTGAESCAQNCFLQGCGFGANFEGQSPVSGGGLFDVGFGGRSAAKIAYWPPMLCATFGALCGLTAAAWRPKSVPSGSPPLTGAWPPKSWPEIDP